VKNLLLIIGLLFYTNLFSQVKYDLENSFTGSYSTTKAGEQFNFSFVGLNSIDYKKISVELNPFYNTQYSPKLSQNELTIRDNIRYVSGNRDLFLTHTFNYSMIRNIDADNFVGLGAGFKFNLDSNVTTNLSYAILYHNTNYSIDPDRERLRHSVRLKMKIISKITHVSFEYYYQPSITNLSDYIIIGSTKFTFFPKSKVNLVVQDFINYRSDDLNFKSIHNFTLGLGIKLSN